MPCFWEGCLNMCLHSSTCLLKTIRPVKQYVFLNCQTTLNTMSWRWVLRPWKLQKKTVASAHAVFLGHQHAQTWHTHTVLQAKCQNGFSTCLGATNSVPFHHGKNNTHPATTHGLRIHTIFAICLRSCVPSQVEPLVQPPPPPTATTTTITTTTTTTTTATPPPEAAAAAPAAVATASVTTAATTAAITAATTAAITAATTAQN